MSTRSGRIRASLIEASPPRTRKGVSPTRSPARTRKSSPPKRKSSPPAPKSPSRKSPSRKSPSRKTVSKFPARKSPSRTTKEATNNIQQKSPAKRPPLKGDNSVRVEDSSKTESFRSTRSKRFDYSIQDVTSSITEKEISLDTVNDDLDIFNTDDLYGLRARGYVKEVTPRRSSRLREFIENVPDIRRSISKSISVTNSNSKSIDKYSDEDSSEEELKRESSMSVTRKLTTPLRTSIGMYGQINDKWEFGGRIGTAALILLIPLTVLAILTSCSNTCSPKTLLDLTIYTNISFWFNIQALIIVVAQFVIQGIMILLPILGTKSSDDTGRMYCFNAFFSAMFTLAMVFILDNIKVLEKTYILDDYISMAIVSYILAVILSLIVYVKSHKVDKEDLNPYGYTGYALYDYFMGREIHAHIKKINIKLWVTRISNINTLILATLISSRGVQLQLTEETKLFNIDYKELVNKVQLQHTILLFSIMQITYILHFIIREYKITTTFLWQSEGVGYLQIVSSALYPFYFTTISKYVADNNLALSVNMLILASLLFMLGFSVMLVSNNIKHEFRKNPLHSSLANLDSMPTFHGKKLLVSNLWGILRHPNYTGDILVHIALAIPGLVSHQWLVVAVALWPAVVLLHRARRDDFRCKRRYGAAWQRYCKRVPSLLIPKVL